MARLFLCILLLLAVGEDITKHTISNRIVSGGLFLRILLAWGSGEGNTILIVLRNILVPVAVLYLFFLLGALGAGDLKLFSLISGYMGLTFWARACLYAFAVGAVWSFLALVKERQLKTKLTEAAVYLFGLLQGHFCTYDSSESIKIPFTVCIAGGGLLALFDMYWR